MRLTSTMRFLIASLFLISLAGCAHDDWTPSGDTRTYGNGEKVKSETSNNTTTLEDTEVSSIFLVEKNSTKLSDNTGTQYLNHLPTGERTFQRPRTKDATSRPLYGGKAYDRPRLDPSAYSRPLYGGKAWD